MDLEGAQKLMGENTRRPSDEPDDDAISPVPPQEDDLSFEEALQQEEGPDYFE